METPSEEREQVNESGGFLSDCCRRQVAVVIGSILWMGYAALQLRHLYISAVRVPHMERRAREKDSFVLPRLYICPADRGRGGGTVHNWLSYQCDLHFRRNHTSCNARLVHYSGRSPETFKADDGGPVQECLEFKTDSAILKQEYDAAWNEIVLRAAFQPGKCASHSDCLQEVELGYQEQEWTPSLENVSIDKYYYPLRRVPFFDFSRAHPDAVATRMFLSLEVDKGLRFAGRYWSTYGSSQIEVSNASIPEQEFFKQRAAQNPLLSAKKVGSVGVVHIILTMEDFEEFKYEVVSSVFPLLGVLGEIAGCGAMMAWLVLRPCMRPGRNHGKVRVPAYSDSDDCNTEIVQVSESARAEEGRALLKTRR